MVTAAERQRVGTLIKKRRQQLGIRTQEELAVLVGTSKTSVAKWESGKYYPSRNLGKLEAVLGISLTAADDPAASLTDPRERELWDLAVQDMPPAQAWEVVEEYRRRRRSRIA